MSNVLFHGLEHEYQQRLCQKVYALLQDAEQYFSRKFPIPDISFRLRGANAGLALLKHNKLRFNSQLLLHNGEKFINDTVAHELAHLITYQLYGQSVKPHGTEWQTIMIDVFHSEPSVTHSFTTTMNRKDIYLYQCHCPQIIEFSKIRHNRSKRGTIYRCRRCRATLTYQGKKGHQKRTPARPKPSMIQKQLPL